VAERKPCRSEPYSMLALYCVAQCSRLQIRQQTLAIGNGTDQGREPVTDEQPTSAAAAKPTVTLESFLTARLDEREDWCTPKAGVRSHWIGPHDSECDALVRDGYGDRGELSCNCGEPARVLADITAKRRILEEHAPGRDRCDEHDASFRTIPCPTILALATVYADHPDYHEEWEVGA